jgi:hypothetical protein
MEHAKYNHATTIDAVKQFISKSRYHQPTETIVVNGPLFRTFGQRNDSVPNFVQQIIT